MSDPRPCGDCGAQPGQPHEDGCDVARCLWTGGQRLQCEFGLIAEAVRSLQDHGSDQLAMDLAEWAGLDDWMHDCGNDVWTGEWPGDADAARLGWFTYWGPDYGEQGWVQCGPDHPAARPDLNRLNAAQARWDRGTHRWEALTTYREAAALAVDGGTILLRRGRYHIPEGGSGLADAVDENGVSPMATFEPTPDEGNR